MMLWMLGVCVQAEETPVYEVTVAEDSVTVCVNGTMTESEYQEMLAALPSSYSSGLITVQENAVLHPGAVSVTMGVENYGTIKSGTYEENVDNYGSITGGTLKTLTNHGSVTRGVITDLYNAADGDVSGYQYRSDGEYYYSVTLNGSVTNYGTINGNYTAYNFTKLLHNEGTLYVYVNRNVWRWDEGYGWEYSEAFYPLASSGTVRDTLGEGWHTTTGEYAGDMQMSIYNDLRQQWSKSDGVLTVKASGSAAVPDSVLADVNAIVVQMGNVSFGTVGVPVTLTRTYCNTNTYYEPTITGGTFNGGVTIEESGHMKNCTLNSDVVMHAAGSVESTNTFGGDAKIVIDKALARSRNLWAYGSFPYTYDAPVEIASTGSVDCCTFNGPVTNYGTIKAGNSPVFNASVTNCGTISGGTFHGGITGSGTLEVSMVVDASTLCAGERVSVSLANPLRTIANAAYQWHYATAQDAAGSAMEGASSDTFTNDTGLGGYVYPVLIVDEVQVEGPRVALSVSGSCGEDVHWTLTGNALTISGTGTMADCASPADVPWAASRNCVVTAVVEEGVTQIGENAFAEHAQLASISLPISLTGIAGNAFDGCPAGMSVRCHADSVAAVFAQENSYTADIEPHDGQSVSGTPASCTEDGLSDGMICKICGYVIQSQEPIPAKGHTSITDDAVAPGCTSTGLTEGSHCGVCGKVLVAQTEVPALGHTSETDTAVAPTDRETGLTEGSHCKVCGAVLVAQEVIPSNFSWDGDVVTGYNAGKTDVVIPSDAIALGDTAFKDNTNITSVTVPESVRSIGEETFSGCTSLKDVYLPDNLESIGSHAFDGVDAVIHVRPGSATATELSRVSVPFTTDDGYTLLYRLSDDTSLPVAVILVRYIGAETALTVPETFDSLPVDEICARAFADNTALESVTLPAGVTTIGVRAFAGCTALTAVSLPANLTAIPGGLFEGCVKLTNARIPESVTSIGSYAYSECAKLSGITLPPALESIGKNAFSGCTRLSSIVIPDSVTKLDTGAFSGCTRLSSVTLSANLTEIADGVFSGCTVLSGLTLPQSVSSIGSRAFYMCEALTEIIIPDGVTAIGANAFSGCTALSSVVMPKNLTTLGDEAFSYCSALNQLVLPDNVAAVGTELLANASTTLYCYMDTLTAQTLTDSGYAYSPIVTIERVEKADGTFDVIATSCANFVVDLVIPEGVTKIGNYAFNGRQTLRSVSLPSTLVSIGEYAFLSCPSLTSIAIPDGVTTIGASAFKHCTSLESAVLPENLYDIYPNTFSYCAALTAISIPEGVESIGDGAFYGCTSLASVTIPESVTAIGNDAFSSCTSLASVTIPEGVTQIGNSVFYGCTSLASVTIPEGVTQIGDSAFYGCTSLTSVTIPESVTSIARSAFYACRAMEHVDLPANITELGELCFNDGITEMKVLYVPSYDCVTALTLTKSGYVYRLEDHAGLHFKSTADEEGGITCTLVDADETITEAVIPNFVTAIADKAFMSCSSLKLVTIPESVTRLGEYVFLECRALERVNLPANITSIAYNCFWNAYPAIYLPTYNCQSALSLHLAGRRTYRLENHDGMIFEGDAEEDGTIICMITGVDHALTEVTIPDFVARVDGAFSGHDSLTSVTIPESVTTIGNNAFYGCTSLPSITIPESVTAIGDYAFDGCSSLASIVLPSGITQLAEYAFVGWDGDLYCNCASVTATTLEALGLRYIPLHHTQVRIPGVPATHRTSGLTEGVTCSACGETLVAQEVIPVLELPVTVLPSSLRALEEEAFANVPVQIVELPEGCQSIGSRAFADCAQLRVVRIPASVTSISDDAFAGCASDLVILTTQDSAAQAFAGRLGMLCVLE